MFKREKKDAVFEKMSKLLTSAIRVGLISSALMFNCVRGDVVVSAGPVIVANQASFAGLAAANSAAFAGGVVGGLPNAVLPFAGGAGVAAVAGCLFTIGAAAANQMPGFADYPTAGGGGTLYLGAMRPIVDAGVPAINTGAGAPLNHTLTRMNNHSHTERQLVIAALNGGNAAINTALLWTAIAGNAAANAAQGGNMCVFVRQAPCAGNPAANNGHLSCVDYYLSMKFPELEFRADNIIILMMKNTKLKRNSNHWPDQYFMSFATDCIMSAKLI